MTVHSISGNCLIASGLPVPMQYACAQHIRAEQYYGSIYLYIIWCSPAFAMFLLNMEWRRLRGKKWSALIQTALLFSILNSCCISCSIYAILYAVRNSFSRMFGRAFKFRLQCSTRSIECEQKKKQKCKYSGHRVSVAYLRCSELSPGKENPNDYDLNELRFAMQSTTNEFWLVWTGLIVVVYTSHVKHRYSYVMAWVQDDECSRIKSDMSVCQRSKVMLSITPIVSYFILSQPTQALSPYFLLHIPFIFPQKISAANKYSYHRSNCACQKITIYNMI